MQDKNEEGIGYSQSPLATALSVEVFKNKMLLGVTVLDSRSAIVFTEGFIPGSIYIGLEGRFVEWANCMLSLKQSLLIVAEKEKEEETVKLLANAGFSNIEGYLKGSFEAWEKAGEAVDMIVNIEADELAMDIPFDKSLLVVDVRHKIEFADGHIKGSINMPLEDMPDINLNLGFEENRNIYLHCVIGYRSVIAASLFKRQGMHNIRNIAGGWEKIKEEKRIRIEKDVNVLN